MAVLDHIAHLRGRLAAVAVGAAVVGLAVPAPAASVPGGTPVPPPSVPATAFTPALPAPTGPYEIGRTTLHLVDRHRPDPWAPDRARELMATVTYPARHTRRHAPGPWFSPAVAESAEAFLAEPPTSAPAGSVDLTGAVAHARDGAPVAHPPTRRRGGWPVVLFSPGFGSFREANTAQIEDLASRGYVVVSFDHTYEAPVVEFPDGRVVEAAPETLSTDLTVLKDVFQRAIDVRVADTRFVVDELAELDRGRNPDAERRRLPRGLPGGLDLSRIGMFGYSYGGYTAGEAMVHDRRIAAGVNLDGSMAHGFGLSEDWPYTPGEVVRRGLDRPFMLFGNEGHDHLGTQESPGDASWPDFWANQRGWKLDISLRGSEHGSFGDVQIVLPQVARALGIPPAPLVPSIGTIDPERSIAAQRAYIGAFFDLHLRHRDDHLLDGPSAAFPEIAFVR
jgi:dienelactone hydrolase